MTVTVSGALLLLSTGEADGYDVDTPFWLTYYPAREAGYTRLQASHIAGAALSVDTNNLTPPVTPQTLHPQDIRARLHALPSSKEAERCAREARRKKLDVASPRA